MYNFLFSITNLSNNFLFFFTYFDNLRFTLSNELNKEELRTNRAKYYKSTSGYDDRIWPYVKEYAKNGDFVWNVGADEFE